MMQTMRAQYSVEEIQEIALVAKVMNAANLASNTFDAFVSRLVGKPSQAGRVVDEVVLSAAFVCVLPVVLAYFSRAAKRPVDEVVRRMVTYTKRMDGEYRNAEGRIGPAAPARARPRKRPARPRARAELLAA